MRAWFKVDSRYEDVVWVVFEFETDKDIFWVTYFDLNVHFVLILNTLFQKLHSMRRAIYNFVGMVRIFL